MTDEIAVDVSIDVEREKRLIRVTVEYHDERETQEVIWHVDVAGAVASSGINKSIEKLNQ